MPVGHLDIRSLRAFVSVVDTGSVTEAARRLCRTQPAITLQIRRLEEQIDKPVFEIGTRRPVLTADGEVMLGYARAILRVHDELWQRMRPRHIADRVVLGTPDLYAAYLLPQILANFRAAYPNIDVEVRCALSRTLMTALRAQEVDIALVTAMPGIPPGQSLCREALVWVSGQNHSVYNENPVPLALLPPGNIIATPPSRRWIVSAARGDWPASARASAACKPRCSPASPSAWSAKARSYRACGS